MGLACACVRVYPSSFNYVKVEGIAGVLETYRQSLKRVQLSSPTLFAPVISKVCIPRTVQPVSSFCPLLDHSISLALGRRDPPVLSPSVLFKGIWIRCLCGTDTARYSMRFAVSNKTAIPTLP